MSEEKPIKAAGVTLPAPVEGKSGNVNPKTGSPWTEEEIAERRIEVWEMRCQGIPVTQMAKRWGVSRQTIHNDIRQLEKRFRERIGGLYESVDRQAVEMGDLLKKLQTISENAFLEYALAATPQAKDKLLNTAMRAEVNRARLMMDLGLLPKAKDAHEVTVKTKVTFAQRFGEDNPITVLSDGSQRRKVLDVAERVIKLQASQGRDAIVIDSPKAVTVESEVEDE